MQEIFLSYRRKDSDIAAELICRDLVAQFGEGAVFLDVKSLSLGVDFADAIATRIRGCKVVLVVIGKDWLQLLRRRINEPDDYLRVEVETSLTHKSETPVIPVLVEGAKMPRASSLPPSLQGLSTLNAIELTSARWSYDLNRLAEEIEPHVGRRISSPGATASDAAGGERTSVLDQPSPAPPGPGSSKPPRRARLRTAAVLSGAAGAVVILALVVLALAGDGTTTQAVITRAASSVPVTVSSVSPASQSTPTTTGAPSGASGSLASPAAGRNPASTPQGVAPSPAPASAPGTPSPQAPAPAPQVTPSQQTPPPPPPPAPPEPDPSDQLQLDQLRLEPQSGPVGTVIKLSVGPCARPSGWQGGEIYFGLSDPANPGADDPVIGKRDWIPGAGWEDRLVVPAGLAPGLYPVWANCYAQDPSTNTWSMFHLYGGADFYVTASGTANTVP